MDVWIKAAETRNFAEEYEEAKRYFDDLLSGMEWCMVSTPDFDSWQCFPFE